MRLITSLCWTMFCDEIYKSKHQTYHNRLVWCITRMQYWTQEARTWVTWREESPFCAQVNSLNTNVHARRDVQNTWNTLMTSFDVSSIPKWNCRPLAEHHRDNKNAEQQPRWARASPRPCPCVRPTKSRLNPIRSQTRVFCEPRVTAPATLS